MKLLGFTLASLAVLALFNVLTARKNKGVPSSYSFSYYVWRDLTHKKNFNIFSAVTLLIAFLMIPPMIQAGDGKAFQFLGFFAPLYLMVVAFAPDYRKIDGKWTKERYCHVIGAWICALCSFLWIILIMGMPWAVFVAFVLVGALAALTESYRSSLTYWAEMMMFASVYICLMLY